jgi:hypothetical protein
MFLFLAKFRLLGTEEKIGPLQTIQKIFPFWWKKGHIFAKL